MHETLIGRLYKRIGIETIVVGDDWHKEWKPVKVERLLDQEKSIVEGGDVPRPKCSYSGGHEIITVSCVNDPYTIICLSPGAIAATDPSALFEGFWADGKTDFEWWISDE